jgi:hypothetical protein
LSISSVKAAEGAAEAEVGVVTAGAVVAAVTAAAEAEPPLEAEAMVVAEAEPPLEAEATVAAQVLGAAIVLPAALKAVADPESEAATRLTTAPG